MLVFGAVNLRANPQAFDFFEKKIRPVLVANCYECHAPESEKIESDCDDIIYITCPVIKHMKIISKHIVNHTKNNRKILYWSIFQTTILLVCGLFQIYHLFLPSTLNIWLRYGFDF